MYQNLDCALFAPLFKALAMLTLLTRQRSHCYEVNTNVTFLVLCGTEKVF